MPPSRRKANHRKPTTIEPSDAMHNRDHPCSKRLHTIAEKLFGSTTDDAFAMTVRDYLLTRNDSIEEVSTKKKKRKKKKKKTSKNGPNQDDDDHHPPETPSPTTTLVGNPSEDCDSMCLPRERVTMLWNHHVVVSNNRRSQTALEIIVSRFSNQAMHVDLVDSMVRPFIRHEMMERRMDRVVTEFLKRHTFHPSAKAAAAAKELEDFLKYSETDRLFFVPFQLVQDAVTDIGCPACRRDAQQVLEQSVRNLELEIATFETTMDDYEPNDYEQDSMYQIMEEGSLPLRDLPKWTFQASEKKDERGWRLTRPLDCRAPWSVSDLEFLLKHGVMAMGLPDHMLFSSSDTGDVVKDIPIESVDNMINGLLASLDKIEGLIKEARQKVDEGKPTDEVLDLNSFDLLRQADEKCDLVLNDLLGIAIKVTSAVNYVQAQYGRDPLQEQQEIEANVFWATEQCSLMWKAFLRCLESILQQLNGYEEARFATADQRGTLEEMYVSLQGRRLFFAYVQQKVKIVSSAATMIKERLLYPTQLGNNSAHCDTPVEFIVRLFMEEACFRSSNYRGAQVKVSQTFADVMTVLREVVETVHAPNIERIVRENHQRWSKLLRVAGGMQDCLIQAKAKVKCRKYAELYDDQVEAICQELTTSLHAFKSIEFENDFDRVRAWRKDFCNGIKSFVEVWLSVATFALDDDPIPTSPVLSRSQLESQLDRSRLDSISLIRHGRCRGGKGASRMVACLVGITFEQIMKQYEEHKANIAMQELLDDAEAKAATNMNHKKKKKVNSSQQDLAGTIKQLDLLGMENRREARADDLLENESQSGNSVSSADSLSSSSHHDDLGTAPSSVEVQVHNMKTEPVAVLDDGIGIYDGADFIAAEAFLVGRLDMLLESGEDVVFVS